jgi:hypothetical protein
MEGHSDTFFISTVCKHNEEYAKEVFAKLQTIDRTANLIEHRLNIPGYFCHRSALWQRLTTRRTHAIKHRTLPTAGIVAELEFSDVQRQVLAADLVEAANDSSSEDGPGPFNGVGAERTRHVIAILVHHNPTG